MLVVSGANALGSFGAALPELTALKSRVDQCVRSFPIVSQTDSGASQAVTCEMFVGGTAGQEGIRAFEKLTLLEDIDNALLFNIAQTLITTWRNTDLGPKVSSTEANVRRIAAQKLGEASVFDAVSPTLAAQALSSAGRIESDNNVKLAIVQSLHVLLKNRDIPSAVRTEAMTTLKILANPDNHPVIDVRVLNAANDALKALAPKLDIGPVTVTPIPSGIAKFKVPLIAVGITAVVAAGGLALLFRHQHATGLSAAGPLRRRAEAALRRRRAR
jgi:hypothetical protein